MTNETQEIDADALRARLAETPADDEGKSMQDEVDELHAIVARQRTILTGVANALRGEPGPLASHGHHDLAERAAAMVALLAVAQSSLEAASSGRRVTACDEIERLQRERDAALAVAAGLREEISDTADTLHRLSLAQQRLASQARAMGDAYLRAAQIVAAIGDPARAATVTP